MTKPIMLFTSPEAAPALGEMMKSHVAAKPEKNPGAQASKQSISSEGKSPAASTAK